MRMAFCAAIIWPFLLMAPNVPAGPIQPSELARIAVSMKPGSWAELKTRGYDAELLKVQNHHILEYTDTAVWDPNSRRVLFVGQGHYSAVKFIAYSEASNSWKLLPTPSWWKGDPKTGKGPIGHAYNNNAINPAKGILYHHQSATRLVHRYDIAKEKWSMLPEIKGAYTGHGTALAYFPEMKGLIRVYGGTVHFYSEEKNTWSLLKEKLPMGPYHNIAKYSPPHKAVILGGGNGSKDLYLLDAKGEFTKLPAAPFVIRISSTTLTIDPVSGDVLVINREDKAKQFFALGLGKKEWRQLPDAPIMDGVAAPIDTYGVNLIFSNRPMKVYLYKHRRQPPTEETIDLRWKFEANKPFYVQISGRMHGTMNVSGKEQVLKQGQTYFLQVTPKRKDEKGNWVLGLKFIGTRITSDSAGNKWDLDSTKPQYSPIGGWFDGLRDFQFKLFLAPNLTIFRTEGSKEFLDRFGGNNRGTEALLKSAFSEDALKKMFEPVFPPIAQKSMSKGGSWTHVSSMDLGPIGSYKTISKYFYAGKKDGLERIKVESRVTYLPPKKSDGLPFKILAASLKSSKNALPGEILFDRTRGRVVRASFASKMEGTVKIDIDGVISDVELGQFQATTTVMVTDQNPLAKKRH